MTNLIRSILLSLLMLVSFTSSANDQQSYGSKVGNKALNGLANMTTSIAEIPKNIINITNDSNLIFGIAGGVGKGILNTFGRILTGITDLITAPIPTKPIVNPAYVWNDFDDDTTYGEIFRLQE